MLTPTLQARLDKRLKQRMQRIALEIEREAKKLAPVDTGNLRNSIRTEQVDGGILIGSFGVEYAAYVEFGTENMAAQSFLRPAVEIVKARHK